MPPAVWPNLGVSTCTCSPGHPTLGRPWDSTISAAQPLVLCCGDNGLEGAHQDLGLTVQQWVHVTGSFSCLCNATRSLSCPMQNSRKGMTPGIPLGLSLAAAGNTMPQGAGLQKSVWQMFTAHLSQKPGPRERVLGDRQMLEAVTRLRTLIHTRDNGAGHSKLVLEKLMSRMTGTEVFSNTCSHSDKTQILSICMSPN